MHRIGIASVPAFHFWARGRPGCRLLLIASRGRWPSKINDYLAAGRPIVAGAVGDVRRLFELYRVGCAVADTPEALAEAADALLGDPALRELMGQAETELAWSILAERLERHYVIALRSTVRAHAA